jgi:asparagine synthase (glutamine-hydrolysing)
MCGICGVVNLHGQPVDMAVGQRMMDLLWHRGPDDSGSLVRQAPASQTSPSIFLGHCRLKIIDLSDAARQPLANEDGTIWVIFNGEIYNFLELRHELEQCGHVFRSRSDTETIVHAYEAFGDDFLTHLDGMFAFALWDGRRQRLILARDRSGKKPLFYTFDGIRMAFASEIKALLACPWVAPRLAVENLPEWLTFGYVPTPRTLFHGIFQVPPASYVVVDRTGLAGPFRYWDLTYGGYSSHVSLPSTQAAGRLRELLTQAVSRRLISDVPLGALLSGGLDSSIIVGLMSQLLQEPVHTFTIGFGDDLSFDERPYAALAARHFKTDHTAFVVNPDTIALIERLLWHHDQPYGDSSAIPTFLVSKLARQYVTVAMNGDGGDEAFAGYDRFFGALVAARLPKSLTPVGRALSRWLPDHNGYHPLRERLDRFLEQAHASVQERFIGWVSLFGVPDLRRLLRPEFAALLEDGRLHRSINDGDLAQDDVPLLHRLLRVNFMTYLPDDLHVKMDRMSMANALETRSPMLDTAFMEFVAALPPDLKIRWGKTKYLLKQAFRDMLPPELLRRKKHGFVVPLGHWFRHQLRTYLEDILLTPRARSTQYFRPEAIHALFQEHCAGIKGHEHRLWMLLNFELWLRMLDKGTLWTPQQSSTEVAIDVTEVTTHSYA